MLDNASYFGRIFARSGGLSDAVAQGLKEHGVTDFELKAVTCDGIEACRMALLKASKGKADGNFIEGMACVGGCIGGAGCLTHGEKNKAEVDAYGIGGDGIVLIRPSAAADASMRMYNSDGTPAEIAANAMRCVAKYLYESGRVKRESMLIETEAGVRSLRCFVRDGKVYSVSIEMKTPDFAAAHVPVKLRAERVVDYPLEFEGESLKITCLSMGNPHCVIFTSDVDRAPLETLGARLETADIFPQRANISFATVLDRYNIKMRVWERGIGETYSCGTGACAVAAAAVELGYCELDSDITLHLRGGDLVVNRRSDGLTLTGDAQIDFIGTIEI